MTTLFWSVVFALGVSLVPLYRLKRSYRSLDESHAVVMACLRSAPNRNGLHEIGVTQAAPMSDIQVRAIADADGFEYLHSSHQRGGHVMWFKRRGEVTDG